MVRGQLQEMSVQNQLVVKKLASVGLGNICSPCSGGEAELRFHGVCNGDDDDCDGIRPGIYERQISGALPEVWKDAYTTDEGWAHVQTVQMILLPETTDENVKQFLCDAGFEELFDFVHVPLEASGRNAGFAVINFKTTSDAKAFHDALCSDTQAPANTLVTPAVVQGFQANYDRYCRSHQPLGPVPYLQAEANQPCHVPARPTKMFCGWCGGRRPSSDHLFCVHCGGVLHDQQKVPMRSVPDYNEFWVTRAQI